MASGGYLVDGEIGSQPECWLRASELAQEVAGVLPQRGERVAVAGCGTSWFMAMAYAALREAAGEGVTDAFPASEMPLGRSYDRVLVITRSGTTTEVLELLRKLRGTVPTVGITAVPGAPIAEVCDELVALEFADEQSVVQTRFATTALALLRASLGEDLTGAVEDVRAVLATELGELPASEQISFLGRGWTVGLAHEAALKVREAAGLWSEAYPAMEYRHGPISIAEPGRTTWMFGEAPTGLAAEVAATGAAYLDSGQHDPMAHLVLAQRVAVAAAVNRGLDPDHPRNLTRSIVLDEV
ncbi:SIS domain-containing protein [Saccharopolyspora indica]|uniref:SIS domain-containing protein n=1 Tax=Saccharopolyspora indica TaxID=1229659 RepID=UPI0022EB827F|nr:SIS domain-containing protein [Saccharopolyspora indica]MDA3642604.1 SIS domain-containing protein [Saccharopolyspora indica]